MVIVIAPGRLTIDAEIVIERARAVGASIILLSEQLVAEQLAGDVTVAIHVPNTVTGITAEVLTTIVTTDALAQAVAAADTERTSNPPTHWKPSANNSASETTAPASCSADVSD